MSDRNKHKSTGARHVQNNTGEPIFDEFNGITIIFQPDQKKNPGTFGFKFDDQGREIRGPGGRRQLFKLSDEKANNVTVAPSGWYDAHYAPLGERQARKLAGLSIVELRVDVLVEQNNRMKARAAEVEAESKKLAEVQDLLAQLTGAAEASGGMDPSMTAGIAQLKGMIASLGAGKAASKK